jgi:uptake hydrogenase large subunit
MGVEGRLTIDLDRAADGSGRATIASSRPLRITRAFVGKTADETVRMIPLVFNVCGMAQGAAAAQACEGALMIEAERGTRCVRQMLVFVETLREHLVRAVMDWPRFLGLEPQTDDMLRVLRLCANIRRFLDPESTALSIGGAGRLEAARITPAIADIVGIIEDIVIGEPLAAWRGRQTADELDAWCRAGATPSQKLVRAVLDRGWANAGQAETRFLPDIPAAELCERLFADDAEAFVAAPTWNGAPCETSALARQAASPLVSDLARRYGSGLLTRLAGRLVEIAELPRAMTDIVEKCGEFHAPNHARDAARPPSRRRSGRGLSQVEAARGRVVHGIEIEENVVRRYAILAPTEWNFHGEGGAARGLAHIAGRAENVREIADLFVTAVDPCVGYELRVH